VKEGSERRIKSVWDYEGSKSRKKRKERNKKDGGGGTSKTQGGWFAQVGVAKQVATMMAPRRQRARAHPKKRMASRAN
jgi:hypothetical protein